MREDLRIARGWHGGCSVETMSEPLRRRRPRVALASTLILAAISALQGCSGADSAPRPAAPSVGEEPAPAPPPATMTPAPPDDHGSVSTKYPAFTPSVAQLVDKGGRILKNPVVVTVTWNDDPNVAVLESVGDTIGASDYWRDVVGEYGVGTATSGPENHVHLSTPLVLDTGPEADPVEPIMKVITDALTNPAASGWPAPTDQSLYLVYIHGAAANQLCELAGGLHDSLKVGAVEVPFAISAACADGFGGFTALEEATISASHELAEAAVDPFPETNPAWQGLHADHLAWELLQMAQDENGDMCEFYEDAYGLHGAPQLPFAVQRSWSNRSAAAGHAPCVPAPKDPNFNVAPLGGDDTIIADFSKSDIPVNPRSKGYLVAVGGSRKIPLGFYTDAATAPFTIDAFESDPLNEYGEPFAPVANPSVTLTLDKTSGQNGEKAYLTVKVDQEKAEKVHLVVVRSVLGGVQRFMPILVGTAGQPAPGSMSTSPSAGAKREKRARFSVSTSSQGRRAASAVRRLQGLGRR